MTGTEHAMTNESPDVSVVLATLNAASTVETAIASILNQEGVRKELIVVDGLSRDATWDIISKHSNAIAKRIREADHGVYSAWNKAIRVAAGRFVCFMGADDQFADSRSLAKLVGAADESCDLVSCRSKYRCETPGEAIEFGSKWSWDGLKRGMCVDNRGALHRRGLFQEYGEFDESFTISGDYEFLLRCGPGLKTAHVDDVLVVAGAGGISRKNYVRRIIERTRAQRRHKVLSVGQACAFMGVDIARELYHGWRSG